MNHRCGATGILLVLGGAVAVLAASATPAELEDQVWSLREQGRFGEAVEVAGQLAATLEAASPRDSMAIADARRLLATVELVAALPPADQLALAEVDSLDAVVNDLRKQKQFAAAHEMVDQQLDIRRRLLGARHHETAATLVAEGRILAAERRLTEAEVVLEDALAIQRAVLGDGHLDTAATLNRLAHLAFLRQDDAVAAARWREVLAINRVRRASDDRAIIATLENLAAVASRQGDLDAGLALRQEVLELTRARHGRDHPRTANALVRLAMSQRALGRAAAAADSYQAALAIYRQHDDTSSAAYAVALNGLAIARLEQGDLIVAEPLQRQALLLLRERFGTGDRRVAVALDNLAFICKAQGDYDDAEELFREALGILRGVQPPDSLQLAATLDYLATVQQVQQRFTPAEINFREALAIRSRILGGRHADVARSQSNLALLLIARDELDEARSLMEESLAIRREALGEHHRGYAAGLANLARWHLAAGEPDAAAPLFASALSLRENCLGRAHPAVGRTYFELARTELARGDLEAAAEWLAKAVAVHDVARLRAGADWRRATAELTDPNNLHAAVLLALDRPDEAWSALEKARARTLGDLLRMADARPLSAAEHAREDSLGRRLLDLEQRAAALRPSTATGAQAADLQLELDRAEAQWAGFQRDLARRFPVAEGGALTVSRIQSHMRAGEAIVGWCGADLGDFGHRAWGFALRSDGPVAWRELPEADTTAAAAADLRRLLATPSSDTRQIRAAGRALHEARLAPLTSLIAGVHELVVVPSGDMLGVPVEVLRDADDQLLDDRFAISYAPSASVLAWLRERPPRTSDLVDRPALLLGDPPFHRDHLAVMDATSIDSAATRSSPIPVDIALTCSDSALALLPRLAASREEVEAVAAAWPDARVLLGAEASEQSLVALEASGDLQEFGLLHLATHALIDDDAPGRSALALARTDLPDPRERVASETRVIDGLITAEEIVREWELTADLVVLSACSTGLGRRVGGEGYLGFCHAFLQAGAGGLVVSLWPVSDRSTALLMGRFHENVTGRYQDDRGLGVGQALSAARAMQEARRHLRELRGRGRRRVFAHPFYWSPFILIGDHAATTE